MFLFKKKILRMSGENSFILLIQEQIDLPTVHKLFIIVVVNKKKKAQLADVVVLAVHL